MFDKNAIQVYTHFLKRKEDSMSKMRRKVYTRLLIVFASIFLLLVFSLFFKFASVKEVFSPSQSIILSKPFHQTDALQLHLTPGTRVPAFDQLAINIFNPTRVRVNCIIKLKEESTQKVLWQEKFFPGLRTKFYNFKEFRFPPIQVVKGKTYILEIESTGPSFSYLSHQPKEQSKDPVFSVNVTAGNEEIKGMVPLYLSRRDTFSILGWIFKETGAASRKLGGIFLQLLALLSLYVVCFSSYKIFSTGNNINGGNSKIENNQTKPARVFENYRANHSLHLFLFGALFLFLLITTSFLIQSNTYSKLNGAEDDAFITYRYSHNIIEGEGFRFNLDEKTLGTTTPLYAMLLAFFGIFTNNLPVVSLLVNWISIFLSGFIVYRLLANYFHPGLAALSGLVFVYFPMFHRILGMETNFLILLLNLSLYLFTRKKYNFSFVLIGLATLTRTEAVLMAPLLMLTILYRKEFKKAVTAGLSFLVSVLPWFIFSQIYFGSFIPNTFFIKTQGGHAAGSVLTRIIDRLTGIIKLEFLDSMFLKSFGAYLHNCFQHHYIWMALFGIALLIGFRKLIKQEYSRNLFSWVLLYVFGFSVLNTPPFIWHYGLAFAILPVVFTLGIIESGAILEKLAGKAKPIMAASLILFTALLIFEGSGVYNIFYSQWYSQPRARLERYETYLTVSDFINEHVPVDKSIAMEEIGIMGYYTPNKVWDFYSLVHKAGMLPFGFPIGSPQRIPYMLTIMDADYVVVSSHRYLTHYAFSDYEIVGVFPVRQYLYDPEFCYMLLKKRENQLVVLGDTDVRKRVSGVIKLRGWVFGTKKIEKVLVLIDGNIFAGTTKFETSPKYFNELFAFNPFARSAIFYIELDTSQFSNRRHRVEFRALHNGLSGSFWSKNVRFVN